MKMVFDLLGYQITEEVYTGNRTLVYRGMRESDQQPIVIKLLRNELPSFNELVQFRNQYTIAKNINCSSIISTYSLEPYNNGYALVMEDFGGISLKQWTDKESGLALGDFLQIAIDLCHTLDILYQARIIHKDIKPANILINPATKQIKLIDFSIASLLPRETQEIKNANALEGTLAYISPEQTGRMNRGIDYRSDFYSLGITFYELLTGGLPFQSNDLMELVHCHLAKTPTPVHEVNPTIPLVLSEIVGKLMAKNAEDRYQSALGIKHDLELCLEQLQETGQIIDFAIGQRDISDRFTIPEKLYGRESEVAQLLAAFARVSTGNTEMMLVAGFSGVGKTAIVNEIHKPIVQQRGYFIKGKFDQFQRNVPFSAFVQAFRDLMRQLFSENDVQLQTWKAKILAAVGENGQVLIDVIPELENIIGSQPPAQELSSGAVQNRFNLLMQRFVQIFTSKEHPLVMFLDDLQWADAASLSLLQLLMQEAGHLLILGAYRDNEVLPTYPLMLMLDTLRKTGASINTITLQPLSFKSLNHLIADTLRCPLASAKILTELIAQKTKGNPFFVTQFLKTLHQDNLFTFDGQIGAWQVDISQVRAAAITDEVVELMAERLQKLPEPTQIVLQLAACIGNQFDLQTLAIISEQTATETATALWEALQEGLILSQDDVSKFYLGDNNLEQASRTETLNYQFLHDRVQQAAYSLIPEVHKAAIHYRIGRLLLVHFPLATQEERIFEIVGHLNLGSGLIFHPVERIDLARLNLLAGRKAIVSTAYGAALEYLNQGIDILPDDTWLHHYDLTLELHNNRLDVAYLNTQFEKLAVWGEIVLQQATSDLDRIKVYETRSMALRAQGRFLEVVETGLQVLQLLGFTFPLQPTSADISAAYGQLQQICQGYDTSRLLNLPTMEDIRILAAMQIMTKMVPSAHIAASGLIPLLTFKQVELSIQYGNCPVSIFSYADYGLILSGFMGDTTTGYEFGNLSLALLEKLQVTPFKSRAYFIVNSFIRHWQEPLQHSLPLLLEGYQSGLESGDWECVGLNLLTYSHYSYWTGRELRGLAEEMETYRQVIDQVRQEATLISHEAYLQAVLNLLGQAEIPYRLQGDVFDADQSLPFLAAINDHAGLFHVHLNQAILCYLFEQNDQAADYAALLATNAGGAMGYFITPIYIFYEALIQLRCYPAAQPDQQTMILEQVAAHQVKLQGWAINAPSNHQHRWQLVAAEQHRVLHQYALAIEYYDWAIASAKTNSYLQDEALANELAARFYLDWGKVRIAASYMQEAYYCYARWGAKAKVADLETRYPQLFQIILQQSKINFNPLETLINVTNSSQSSSQATNIADALDFASVLKAAQVLSSEIHFDELLKKLTQIILQNSGADKCILALPEDGIWQVRISTLKVTELCSEPLDHHPQVPTRLIQYVKRTKAVVVINNLKTNLPVIGDYLRQQQPQSILCLPILSQGHLVGILYLENHMTSEIFTSDRLTVINFLCIQAAISLENATLYQTLQQNELKFRAFVEDVNDLIFSATLDAVFTYLSPQFQGMLGYEVSDFLNQSFVPLVHPDDLAKVSAFNQQIADTGEKLAGLEFRTQHQDGTWLWVTCNNSPIKDEQGKVIGIRGIARDISDRKRAESVITEKSQELEKALQNLQQTQLQVIQGEKMSALGNLVAGVAHEINNPVGFLTGNIQPALDYINDLFGLIDLYQQKHPRPDAEIQEEIEEIDLEYIREDLPKLVGSMREGVKRIKDISTSLRTFSRADSHRPIACNIHDGIDSTILILKHRLKANESRPEIEVIKNYGSLPQLECYAGQLNQVFMNILANAIDALDESNQDRTFAEIRANPNYITITTSVENDRVKIAIADNGKGMSEEVKAKIFDHLFTTKSVGKGTGLGLAIAQQIIVEKHNGTINVNSQLGQGTEFIITLPINSK